MPSNDRRTEPLRLCQHSGHVSRVREPLSSVKENALEFEPSFRIVGESTRELDRCQRDGNNSDPANERETDTGYICDRSRDNTPI